MQIKDLEEKYLRIVYVYRCPKMGYSIQRSFNAIENEIKKRKNVEVDSIYFDNTKFSLNACVKMSLLL